MKNFIFPLACLGLIIWPGALYFHVGGFPLIGGVLLWAAGTGIITYQVLKTGNADLFGNVVCILATVLVLIFGATAMFG